MRVVVDEGVPRQLVRLLRDHGIDAEPFDPTWRGKTNGDLIALVQLAGYDVLLTSDKNIGSQQNLSAKRIAIVALPLNRRLSLMRRVEDIADTISRAGSHQQITMGRDGTRMAVRTTDGHVVIDELPPIAPFER